MRAFLAIPIDHDTAKQLQQIAHPLKKHSWSKHAHWFPIKNYHLTLQFIGAKVSTEKITEVMKSMDHWLESTSCSSFRLPIEQIALFPNRQEAHTLAALLPNNTALQSIMHEIDSQMQRLGLERAKMQFRPHISLAKLRPKTDYTAARIPEQIQYPQDLSVNVNRVTLFESQLTSQSPIYHELKTLNLKMENA